MDSTKDTKGTIDIRFKISKELHKVIKVLAVQNDTSMQKLLPVLLSAGIAHHAQLAQSAKSSTEKPNRINRTKSTDGTKGTAVTVVPLDKRT